MSSSFGCDCRRAFLHAEVMLVYEMPRDWRFEHPLPISDKLASVMFLQPLRLSDWRFEHPLPTSDTLASVMLMQYWRSSIWRFEHPLPISAKLASVIPDWVYLFLRLRLSVWSFEHPLPTSAKPVSVMLSQNERLRV